MRTMRTFNPMLAEVVGAGVFPEHVIAPVREMIHTAQFIMARITHIDTAQRVMRCETLAGVQDIAYDHLVMAFGQRANMDIIPGMAEHALPLKLVGDALVSSVVDGLPACIRSAASDPAAAGYRYCQGSGTPPTCPDGVPRGTCDLVKPGGAGEETRLEPVAGWVSGARRGPRA